MTDWNEAERIYAKLHKEGDITWKESDVIFKILYDRIFSKSLSREDNNKSQKFLKKWLDSILSFTGHGKKGIFLHTIIHNLKERYWNVPYSNYVEEMFLIKDIDINIRDHLLLEEKDKAVILTLKGRDGVFKFLNKKISRNLAGRKYQKFDYRYNYSLTGSGSYSKEMITDRYDKYFFEIYRPMTLTRIGFDDYVKLDMNNADFTAACVFYGDKENKEVCRLSHLYEKAIEIMLDMGVPMYAYSITPFNSMLDSLFDMFVHKDYAQEAGMIFNALPYIAKKDIFNSGVRKHDRELSDFVAGIITSYMTKKEKQEYLNKDEWLEMGK